MQCSFSRFQRERVQWPNGVCGVLVMWLVAKAYRLSPGCYLCLVKITRGAATKSCWRKVARVVEQDQLAKSTRPWLKVNYLEKNCFTGYRRYDFSYATRDICRLFFYTNRKTKHLLKFVKVSLGWFNHRFTRFFLPHICSYTVEVTR